VSNELVASQLIAVAIAQRLKTARLGVRADGLPILNTEHFVRNLEAETSDPLRIGLLGYDVDHLRKPNITSEIEIVIEWRNDPRLKAKKIVVVMHPEHLQEKTHSLHMLEPFDDRHLQDAILAIGQKDAPSLLVGNLWKELAQPRTKRRLHLVARQLIDLYTCIDKGEQVGNALPSLRLLPDYSIKKYQDNLHPRLTKNRSNLDWLDGLDSGAQRELSRALANGSAKNAKTFRLVKLYRYDPSPECIFWAMPISDSDSCRSRILVYADQ